MKIMEHVKGQSIDAILILSRRRMGGGRILSHLNQEQKAKSSIECWSVESGSLVVPHTQ
jgi:hypothetical protein